MRWRTIAIISGLLLLAAAASAIEVVTPSEGSTVAPGASVRVEIAPSIDETITEFRVLTREGTFEAVPGQLSVDIVVPLKAVGPMLVTAFAVLDGGEVDFVVVELVAEPGPLLDLVVSVPSVFRRVGQVYPLDVSGIFQDGVVRDVSLPERGTTYESTDPDVLGVHPTGLVQARERGRAQVVVRNRGRVRAVSVDVDVPSPGDNDIPVPEAGPDQTVAPESLVELSGLDSTDADGDTLSFTWKQISGRPVILHDPSTPEPFFIAPAVTIEDALSFSLVVRDARGAESFPDIVRVTVSP